MSFKRDSFTGSIPIVLGTLSKLRYLDLSGNRLSRSIPTQLGDLKKLVVINVRNDIFIGRFPSKIRKLRRLLRRRHNFWVASSKMHS